MTIGRIGQGSGAVGWKEDIYDKICHWASTKIHRWKIGKKDLTRGRPADETSDNETDDEAANDVKMRKKLPFARYTK